LRPSSDCFDAGLASETLSISLIGSDP
jgi:hypothetical protein